jgi:hypothetical protein
MQHNQSPNGVEVQVFAKKLNAKPERVLVEIGQRHLKVQIKDEDCNEVEYTFDEDLYHEVDVESSCFKILGTQVLVKLKKADNSITWPSLTNTDVPVCAPVCCVNSEQFYWSFMQNSDVHASAFHRLCGQASCVKSLPSHSPSRSVATPRVTPFIEIR